MTGRAIRTGRPVVDRSLDQENATPWREELEAAGYESFASFPLVVDDRVFGAFSLYAGEPDAFHENEVKVLEELVGDLAYGVTSLRARTQRHEAVAALERSEERYRKLVEGTPYGVLIVDMTDKIRYASPAASQLLGITATDELAGRSWREFVAPGSMEQARNFALFVGKGEAVASREGELVRADGTRSWVDATAVPFDFEGEPAVYVLLRDISARRQAEADLRSAQEQLHQSQKLESVGQLAGGIAHDFNNLLTVIAGDTELLIGDDRTADPEIREYLDEIRIAADQATMLTSQLLAFSRRQPYKTSVVDLNDAAGQMDSLLRRTMGEEISLDTIFSEDLWPVEIDPHRLGQVILNLALNARDAMPEGGKLTLETANAVLDETYVATHLGSSPGEHVMLAVSDNGMGMDRQTADRIFDPFFTTKEHGKGTGLGLSTVYGMVKQFGGNIWVYSEPGEGTTFKVFLPRSEKKVDWHPAAVDDSSADRDLRGTETVLVTEDERPVQKLAERILAREGYRVLAASSGAEAIEVARSHSGAIDLLLTDVVLPGLDGRELADALREIRPGLKVLYMSGYTKNAVVHAGRLDEGVTLVEKPFRREELARAVREALDAQ